MFQRYFLIQFKYNDKRISVALRLSLFILFKGKRISVALSVLKYPGHPLAAQIWVQVHK